MPGAQQHYCLNLVDKAIASLFPPDRPANGTIRARINDFAPSGFECDVEAPAEYVGEIITAIDENLKGLEYRLVIRPW